MLFRRHGGIGVVIPPGEGGAEKSRLSDREINVRLTRGPKADPRTPVARTTIGNGRQRLGHRLAQQRHGVDLNRRQQSLTIGVVPVGRRVADTCRPLNVTQNHRVGSADPSQFHCLLQQRLPQVAMVVRRCSHVDESYILTVRAPDHARKRGTRAGSGPYPRHMTATFKNRTLEQRRQAVANLYDFVVRGGMADTTRTPSEVIDEGHKSTLHRYVPTTGSAKAIRFCSCRPGFPVGMLRLAAGCSLAEHFVSAGRPTCLVDYGEMRLSDRELGIEFWVSEVAPNAIKKVSQDAGGAPVHLVGWCLGGVISILTAAAYPDLPIKSVAMVASPFDVSKNPMVAPVRAAGNTGGRIFGTF